MVFGRFRWFSEALEALGATMILFYGILTITIQLAEEAQKKLKVKNCHKN